MISLLIWLIVVCLIFGLIYYAITLLPLPAPFKTVVLVAMLIILILMLVSLVVPVPWHPSPALLR